MADVRKKRDGQFAAEMLLEIRQPLQQSGFPLGVLLSQCIMPQREAKPFENAKYAPVFALRQQSRHDRIPGIERDTDRDRLAMVDFVVREMFELVGGPVSKIQRPRGPRFERIATEPYLAHMQFRAILDQAIEMGRRKLRQRHRIAFDPAKEIAVAD